MPNLKGRICVLGLLLVCLQSSSGCRVLKLLSPRVFLGFTYCLLSRFHVLCSASARGCSATLLRLCVQVGYSLISALSSSMKKFFSSGEHTEAIALNTLFNTFSFPVTLKFHLSGFFKKKAKSAG